MKNLSRCPVESFFKLIGQRWSTYILHMFFLNGPLRFGSLKARVTGITQKVLTAKLRELEAAGIIYRDYLPSIPPQVTYGLTEQGETLIPFLKLSSTIAHDWREKGYL